MDGNRQDGRSSKGKRAVHVLGDTSLEALKVLDGQLIVLHAFLSYRGQTTFESGILRWDPLMSSAQSSKYCVFFPSRLVFLARTCTCEVHHLQGEHPGRTGKAFRIVRAALRCVTISSEDRVLQIISVICSFQAVQEKIALLNPSIQKMR